MGNKRAGVAGVLLALGIFVGTIAFNSEGVGGTVLWVVFALLIVSSVTLYLWPASPERPDQTGDAATATDHSIAQTGDATIAQLGDRNVVVQRGGTYNEAATTHTEADDRIFVDLTPTQLAQIYEKHITIEADAVASRYIGKWLRTEIEVRDLYGSFPDRLSVMGYDTARTIVSGAVAVGQEEKFTVLQRGAQVRVVGSINRIDDTGVNLLDVELDVRGPDELPK